MRYCRWLIVMSACFMFLGISQSSLAQPPGGQLIDKVRQAYRDIDFYDATVHLSLKQVQGRWTNIQSADYFVAFDRPDNRLLIDGPDQLVVCDGSKLYYRTVHIPGKHLEVDMTSPLTSEWIVQQTPDLVYPAFPTDMAFLLSDDPLQFVSQGAAGAPATLPPDPDDPLKRPRIESALQVGKLILTIDPKSFLIDQAKVEADTVQMGLPFGTEMSYTFNIDVHNTDELADTDRFVFDTANSKASPSMQYMMASGANAPHPLVDQPAPALNLPDIDGNAHDIAVDDKEAQVIVLDFFATWCGPCVMALPDLQKVYDWVQTEGKPVAIYAVNQGETVEEVKQFWADNNLSIPVLMDENFTAGQSYHANTIPQTVIIANGKVTQVHGGYAPGMEDQLKAEIKALLAE